MHTFQIKTGFGSSWMHCARSGGSCPSVQKGWVSLVANRASRKMVTCYNRLPKTFVPFQKWAEALTWDWLFGDVLPDDVIAELQNHDPPQIICGKAKCRVDRALSVTTRHQTKTFKNTRHRCALLPRMWVLLFSVSVCISPQFWVRGSPLFCCR